MYVIYPADELLRIYENPIRQSVLTSTPAFPRRPSKSGNDDRKQKISAVNHKNDKSRKVKVEGSNRFSKTASVKNASQRSRVRDRNAKQAIMQNTRNLVEEGTNPLKDLTHASSNEPLKQHNGNTVKLVQIGKSIFTIFLHFYCTSVHLSHLKVKTCPPSPQTPLSLHSLLFTPLLLCRFSNFNNFFSTFQISLRSLFFYKIQLKVIDIKLKKQ